LLKEITISEKHYEMLKHYNGLTVKVNGDEFKLLSTKEITENYKNGVPLFSINGNVIAYSGDEDVLKILREGFQEFVNSVKKKNNPFYALKGVKEGKYEGRGDVDIPEDLEGISSLAIITDVARFRGFSKLKGLKNLEIVANRVEEGFFSELCSLQNLESLTLNVGNISELDLRNLENLKGLKSLRLILRDGGLEFGFLNGLKGLESLTVENLADLDVFEGIESDLKFLRVINLEYLRGFQWLRGFKNLIELHLESIGGVYLKGDISLEGLNWKVLRIKKGNTISAPQTLKLPNTLRILEMSYLSLKSLPEIYGGNLLELDLRGNELERINGLDGLKKLTDIDLSDNKIKDVNSWLCEFKNLETLILNNNQIEEFSPNCTLENLYRLELKGNPIKNINKKAIPNIKVLLV
ncbi:MAG: hypothetical protein ABIL23_02225, partial [candidate division WOR-3 bacterium]